MTKNFAHRGFSGLYPENTMLAFSKAVEAGADGIELDVHFTKDKQVVIIHDETVDRTTDGTGFVEDFTLEELSRLNAYGRFREKYPFQKIPTLIEYFSFIKRFPRFMTNIELKTGINEYPGIEKAVLEIIDEFDMRSNIIISSFNHFSVLRFKELAGDVRCGFLEESRIIDFGSYARKNGVEFIHPMFCNLTDDVVKEVRDNRIGINTWTVNSEKDIRRMFEIGVDAIISNYPDRVMNISKNF